MAFRPSDAIGFRACPTCMASSLATKHHKLVPKDHPAPFKTTAHALPHVDTIGAGLRRLSMRQSRDIHSMESVPMS